MPLTSESGPSGQADSYQHVSALFRCIGAVLIMPIAHNSIRFAPPLVISEAELDKAISIIEGALSDLDKVSLWLGPVLDWRGPDTDSLG